MGNYSFVKGSERLVDPITVGSVHFIQQLFGMLPRTFQRKVIEGAAESTPYMGFIVEPYATFLFCEIGDEKRAVTLLPDGFRLARASVFEGDEPASYAVISLFRIHTSTFWGARAEFYLIAQDERTGLLSWVIIDYLSDTVSYDRANGLRGPSAPGAVITTSADGCVVVDLQDPQGQRAMEFVAALADAKPRPLDSRLWVEGNLSVAYGPALSPSDPGVFALTFPREEMAEALDVPLESLDLERMEWHADILKPAPARVACFPFAQHLLSDTPGASSGHASAENMESAAAALDFAVIPKFKTGPIRSGMIAGTAISCALALALAFSLARSGKPNR